jgi:putative phosphoribosyl transferase
VIPISTLVFANRRSAAQALAAELRPYATPDAVVLGITRGGVVVAHEVARLLGLPLDVLVVQRIRLPDQPWHSVGALAEPGHMVVNRRRLRGLAVRAHPLRPAITQGIQEVQLRAAGYRGSRQRLEPVDQRVILIDDTAATGSTLRVSVKAVRALGAREIIVALPVAPTAVVEWLRGHVDHTVCLTRSAMLITDKVHYPLALQETEADLQAMLAEAESRNRGQVPVRYDITRVVREGTLVPVEHKTETTNNAR